MGWKPFRNAFDKKDGNEFDDIFGISKFYISACPNSAQYVRLNPIMMSMLLYHYKQLRKYISELDPIETRVNNKHRRILTVKNNEAVEEPEKPEVKSKAATCEIQ
jgi:hypothetical protein